MLGIDYRCLNWHGLRRRHRKRDPARQSLAARPPRQKQAAAAEATGGRDRVQSAGAVMEDTHSSSQWQIDHRTIKKIKMKIKMRMDLFFLVSMNCRAQRKSEGSKRVRESERV